MIFGEAAGDCDNLEEKVVQFLSATEVWPQNATKSTLHHQPGFSSRRMHRLLTVAYPSFLVLPRGGLNWLVLQDRTFFGFLFQISFESLRSISGLCAQAKVLLICNIDADSRCSHTMHFPFTAKPHQHFLTFPPPSPHHHHHQWPLSTNNCRRHSLPSMV